jgi:tyrosyl-tRNA synthetase
MYKMVSKVTRDASALVPGNTLATHLSPIYYALDIHYANVDAVLIGEDYRPFAELSQELCKSLGFPLQAALIAPILNGMDGNKMSSTKPDFHLDPLDTANQIKKKIGSSFCEPGNLKGNIALELAKNVIFPMLKNGGDNCKFYG